MHSDLRPTETVQKLLISTTSRLVGEFERENLLVTHAFPDLTNMSAFMRLEENALSRSCYVFAFRTEPVKPGAGPLPDYRPSGDIVCAYLSILYGKRFDNHGLRESLGIYFVPEIDMSASVCKPTLPQNSHSPRKDLAIPLELPEISRIERLFLDPSLDQRFRQFLSTAGMFYSKALQGFEREPEIAYLNLITAGEVISNFYDYPKEELLDDQVKSALKTIEETMEGSEKIVRLLKSQLLQIKRRFLKTACALINSHFFSNTECAKDFGALKRKDFERRLAAAYDVRSRYIHTGFPFGECVSRQLVKNNEIQVGPRVVIADKEFAKTLALAPTFIGLERVIRYCLLRFIHLNGIPIDPVLDDMAA